MKERKGTCSACGKPFRRNIRGPIAIICAQCRQIDRIRRWAELRRGTPYIRKLHGWHARLAETLSATPRPHEADETWLTINEIRREISGLSLMRIYWLGCRKLVRVKPHPTKKWRRKPVTTYAQSDLLIAERIFHEKRRKKE